MVCWLKVGGMEVGVATAGGTGATGTRLPPGRGEKVGSCANGGEKTAAIAGRRPKPHGLEGLLSSMDSPHGVLAGCRGKHLGVGANPTADPDLSGVGGV